MNATLKGQNDAATDFAQGASWASRQDAKGYATYTLKINGDDYADAYFGKLAALTAQRRRLACR